MTLDEIKYVNNSKVFKNGILEFPSDLEDELYEVLRIDKDKVLNDVVNNIDNKLSSAEQKVLEVFKENE